MKTLDALTRLVEEQYDLHHPKLIPIHQFETAGRGIFRVQSGTSPPWLLRAYRSHQQTGQWLESRANVLQFLEEQDFPAPRVVANREGFPISQFEGWSTLMLTFIEGNVYIEEPADLVGIGDVLAKLHQIDIGQSSQTQQSVPLCRWQPREMLLTWLDALHDIEDAIPPELTDRYRFCVDTLSKVVAWPDLPTAILHTDCCSPNAVHTEHNQIVLIDWDGAGLGPAVMDLGYLLLNCHVGQSEWPVIIPDQKRIGDVLDGYCRQRTLTDSEIDALSAAIGFAECHHNIKALPAVIPGDWRTNRGLTRFHKRYEIVPTIAEIATRILLP